MPICFCPFAIDADDRLRVVIVLVVVVVVGEEEEGKVLLEAAMNDPSGRESKEDTGGKVPPTYGITVILCLAGSQQNVDTCHESTWKFATILV